MKSSLLLGEIYKIKLYVHWTFLLLIAWALITGLKDGLTLEQSITRILFIFAIFACVVLHELGHALTARRFGYQTRRIVLLPIGGMAQIERMPEDPWQELVVAIAGPIVSFAIALLLYIIISISSSIPSMQEIENANDFLNQYFLFNLCLVNLMLAIFNLIPAFPMDGGRIFRAFLAMNMNRTKATQIASFTGQFIAILFIIFGINSQNLWLTVIGVFIFLAAKGEAVNEGIKSSLSRYKVKDLTMHQYTILSFNDTIDKAVAIILNSQEREFIVMNGQIVVGVLTRDDVIRALAQKNNSAFLHQAMNKKFLKLNPNMKLQDAYEQMLVNRFTVAAVIEGDKLIGILDMENIQEFMLFKDTAKK